VVLITRGDTHASRGEAHVRAAHPASGAADRRRALGLWDKATAAEIEERFERRGHMLCWPLWRTGSSARHVAEKRRRRRRELLAATTIVHGHCACVSRSRGRHADGISDLPLAHGQSVRLLCRVTIGWSMDEPTAVSPRCRITNTCQQIGAGMKPSGPTIRTNPN
jgi:hypothetical protein